MLNFPHVYRDIKPENFMLQTKGDPSQIKMIDFGLSKDFGEGTGEMKTMSGSVSVRILSDRIRFDI